MKVRHLLLIAAVVSVLSGSGSPSHAELYRCERPDGSTTYTDDPMACPGARPHEPRGQVQSVASTRVPTASATARRIEKMRRKLEAEAERAALWQQKKTNAEQEVAEVAVKRDMLRRHVINCNRGGSAYITKESGLKVSVSCRSLGDKFAALESRHAELTAYLDGGLRQECHRAGCLPGWVR